MLQMLDQCLVFLIPVVTYMIHLQSFFFRTEYECESSNEQHLCACKRFVQHAVQVKLVISNSGVIVSRSNIEK